MDSVVFQNDVVFVVSGVGKLVVYYSDGHGGET